MRLVDNKIPIGAICIAADWDFPTAINLLVQAGIDRHDACQFASLEFHARHHIQHPDLETFPISDQNLKRITNV